MPCCAIHSHVDNDILFSRSPPNEQLIIDYVDPCLTSIYQPPDVSMNKPLKHRLKSLYTQHVREVSSEFKAGDKVTVTREKLISMIEQVYDDINDGQKKTRGIAKSFDQCGLNPWCKDTSDLINHLDNLSTNAVYKSLTEQHSAARLCATRKM